MDQLTEAIEKVKRRRTRLCLFSIPMESVDTARRPPGEARSTALHRMKQKAGVDPVHLAQARLTVWCWVLSCTLAVMQGSPPEVLASSRAGKIDAQNPASLPGPEATATDIQQHRHHAELHHEVVTIGDAIITPRRRRHVAGAALAAAEMPRAHPQLQREIADMRRIAVMPPRLSTNGRNCSTCPRSTSIMRLAYR